VAAPLPTSTVQGENFVVHFFFLPLHIDEVIDSLSLLSSKIITETKKKKIKITKAKVCAQNAARSYEYRSAVLWQHRRFWLLHLVNKIIMAATMTASFLFLVSLPQK